MFGATASTANLFGTPAGTTASAPFGSAAVQPSSAGLFGAGNTTGSLFGSTAAAGQAASTPSLFGASSSPGLFGASSTPGLFGASSTPSLFGASPAPSLFGASSAAPQSAPSLFGANTAGGIFGGAQLQPQQQQQQPGSLSTKDLKPLTHATKWDDVHPSSQNQLLELEKLIVSHREQCQLLDSDGRLKDTGAMQKSIKDDTDAMSMSLRALLNAVKAENNGLGVLREKVIQLLRSTESACRTFERTKNWRTISKQIAGGQIQAADPRIQEAIGGPPVLPSPFLEGAVAGMEELLSQYKGMVLELQGLVATKADALAHDEGAAGALFHALNNMHDFFVHVAAKVERLHDGVQMEKDKYLASQRKLGYVRDPFEEAAMQEAAREKAAAEREKARIAASTLAQASAPAAPASAPLALPPAASSSPGLFSTPQTPAVSTPGSIFGATQPSLFGSAAPSPAPFATPPTGLSTGGFGASTGGGLFGSTLGAATFGSAGLFGGATGSGGMTRSKSRGRKK